MYGSRDHACLMQTRANLHVTAGIAGRNERGTRVGDVTQLGIKYALARFGLHEVVDARAATAMFSLCERQQHESGHHGKYAQRWGRDTLRVQQVTRCVVGDGHRNGRARARAR